MKIRNINIKKPYCSSFINSFASLYGSCESNILDPSSGGIGSKLNTPKSKFINTPYLSKLPIRAGNVTGKTSRIRKTSAQKIANPKLAKIPADDTKSSPFLIFLKFKGLTGTGFAQASIGPGGVPVSIAGIKIKAGRRIVPIGSICGSGFRVNLPALWAVVSPNFKATSPCMTSCNMTENKRIIIDSAKNSGM